MLQLLCSHSPLGYAFFEAQAVPADTEGLLLGGLLHFQGTKSLQMNHLPFSQPFPSQPCQASLLCLFLCPLLIRNVINQQRKEAGASVLCSTRRAETDGSNAAPLVVKTQRCGLEF